MKKLMSVFLAVVLSVLVVVPVWAAGSSMTVAGDSVVRSAARNRIVARVITVSFVADSANGSIPDLTLNASTTGLNGNSLRGWFGHKVLIDCNHAGTEPSENSELYIYENGFDLLGAGGVDQVDNTAERLVWFSDGTTKRNLIITGDLVVRVTQQAAAVNSATGTIYITFVTGE